MNRRHKAAQYAQRASVNLNTLLYFKLKPSVEDAYVLSVMPDAVTILVPRFGIEGTVNFELKSGSNGDTSTGTGTGVSPVYKYNIQAIEHDPDAHTVQLSCSNNPSSSSPSSITLQVFQQVRVKIVTVESASGQRNLEIDLLLDETAALTATGGSDKRGVASGSSSGSVDESQTLHSNEGKKKKKQRRV